MKKGWIWTAAIAAAIGLGIGTAGGYALSGGDDRLPDRMSVGGLEVGGRTAQEALTAVRERIRALEETEVAPGGRILAGGGDGRADSEPAPKLTLKRLGMSVGAEEALRDLEAFRDAKWWQRGKMKKTLRQTYAINVKWDEAAFKREAESAWGRLVAAPARDASRSINERDEVVYTPEAPGTALDTKTLMAEVVRRAPTSLAPGGLSAASAGSFQALSVGLPTVKTAPKATVASLKEEGISRKIAEFATSFATSSEGRSHNVTVTAKALDGTLLQPGEVFDFGAIVAKAEKEYGYREAPVIVNGKLTPGVGGGICQVSSTLYNAVIRTEGIDIVERRNHSLPVHYLPAGLDATFAEGYINFRFRNSTGKQLLIKTDVRDRQLTVKLFGTMDESVSYGIETVERQIVAPKVVYVADGTLAPGESKVLQKGDSGYVIESYRVKYVDGKFVERARLSRDTYRSQNELVAVNAADPRLAPPEADGNNGGNEAPAPTQPQPDAGNGGPVEPV
ncbi:VanW family protein [Cohnella thermotolerans]|uniref:VanW family protein n=1 Tax=Cohnella thermotolerans TaxID=329858 RepID=UPI0006859CCD|nr:VanW family protein [Cohnella thermotolerans]